jgi:CDP-diacylglycerol--glycerol-3-phosphate 3-phosphatidyltransferase
MKSESTLRRLQRSISESKRIYTRSPKLRISIYRFGAVSAVALALITVGLFSYSGDRVWLRILLWTAPLIGIYIAYVLCSLPYIRDRSGAQREGFEAANILTSLRLFAVPPVLVLLLEGRVVTAAALYLVAVTTDMIDGYVARKYGQETVFGVMLDPVADILLTMALFLFLWLNGDIPLWLFIILVIRYTQFFAGLIVLAALDSTPTLRATATGKFVGVVQALGIILLMVRAVTGIAWPPGMYRLLIYLALGTAFSSVIVSQSVIGWKALKKQANRR